MMNQSFMFLVVLLISIGNIVQANENSKTAANLNTHFTNRKNKKTRPKARELVLLKKILVRILEHYPLKYSNDYFFEMESIFWAIYSTHPKAYNCHRISH